MVIETMHHLVGVLANAGAMRRLGMRDVQLATISPREACGTAATKEVVAYSSEKRAIREGVEKLKGSKNPPSSPEDFLLHTFDAQHPEAKPYCRALVDIVDRVYAFNRHAFYDWIPKKIGPGYMTKFTMFALPDFDAVLYLDHDAGIMQPVDELWDHQKPAISYWARNGVPNSGVVLFEPSLEDYFGILTVLANVSLVDEDTRRHNFDRQLADFERLGQWFDSMPVPGNPPPKNDDDRLQPQLTSKYPNPVGYVADLDQPFFEAYFASVGKMLYALGSEYNIRASDLNNPRYKEPNTYVALKLLFRSGPVKIMHFTRHKIGRLGPECARLNLDIGPLLRAAFCQYLRDARATVQRPEYRPHLSGPEKGHIANGDNIGDNKHFVVSRLVEACYETCKAIYRAQRANATAPLPPS